MRRYRLDTAYGVGLTSSAIVTLRSFGVAVPHVIYRPFQVVYGRGNITRAGDGPESVEWVWDILYLEKFASLVRYLFADEDAQSADCYVRTDKRVGWYGKPSQAFATFSATVWRPLLCGPDGSYAPDTPYQLSTVRLIFKNLSEVP